MVPSSRTRIQPYSASVIFTPSSSCRALRIRSCFACPIRSKKRQCTWQGFYMFYIICYKMQYNCRFFVLDTAAVWEEKHLFSFFSCLAPLSNWKCMLIFLKSQAGWSPCNIGSNHTCKVINSTWSGCSWQGACNKKVHFNFFFLLHRGPGF